MSGIYILKTKTDWNVPGYRVAYHDLYEDLIGGFDDVSATFKLNGCQINEVFGNCSPVLGLVKAYKVARLLALEHEETSDGIFIINQGANLTFEEIVNDTNS